MEPVFAFPIALDAPGAGGRMRALHAGLRAAILDGRLAPGAQLPSTRRVAEAFGVGRNTVVAAYDLLVAEGYVSPRRGARAVVADFASRGARRRDPPVARIADPRIHPRWATAAPLPAPRPELPERSFRLGVPEHRQFPHDAWRRLSARTLRAWSRRPFGYAPTQGIAELRDAIARHVAFARAVACSGDDVIVTSGAQQAFDLLARMLVRPGQTRVAVEDPGYPTFAAAFAAAGARIVPVPVDEEGMCVECLPDDVRVVSVTPSHQSPTGAALSLRRRAALLEFARARDAVVIEDDYDGEFRFGGRPLDALQTLDRDARVFYVGTFSKSLFPALRKGFVVAPAWARDSLVAIKHLADSHGDAIAQALLAAFIDEGHLARHVRRMRPIYAARRRTLLDGLRRELATWLEPIPSEAGLHLAARIRDPSLAGAIVARARECTPGAQPVSEYSTTGSVPPAIAFGYGVIDAHEIPPALARLRRALERGGPLLAGG